MVKSLAQMIRRLHNTAEGLPVQEDKNKENKIALAIKHHRGMILFIFFLSLFLAIVYFGAAATGFVVFSETTAKAEAESIHATRPGTFQIKTDLENINAVLLSGKVYGKGNAAVFLVMPEKKYLAYYFSGDATTGVNFTGMCYDTCHIEGLPNENTLEIQLEGTTIDIDKVSYLHSKIIDIDIQPREISIDYNTEPAKIVELKLTNNEATDYNVLLYIDGPLAGSFSWQGSLIHMAANETEKTVRVTAKLPDNLPKGSYTQKITARYVPPGTYDFVGETPVAESFITVHNQ